MTKLTQYELARMASEDAGRSAQLRLNALGNGADGQQMASQLSLERNRHAERFQLLSQLVSRLKQFVAELPGNTVLESVPAPDIELMDGETLGSAIEAVRSQISAVQERLRVVRSSALPVDDQKDAAADLVTQMLARGRPSISFVRDQIKVTPRGDMLSGDDMLSLLAWFAPGAMLHALEREIDQRPAPAGASLSAHERQQIVSELETKLLDLERHEAALVEACDGTVLPRATADARAVLGLMVIAQQQQVAVA
jgi:hypothetical protein